MYNLKDKLLTEMARKILVFSTLLICVLGQHYEDKRCRCICPSVSSIINTSPGSDRRLYIVNVPRNKCNCGAILPKLSDQIKGHEQEFCLWCDCKYESRKTTIIMVVVVAVICMICVLFIYMGFLVCLRPFVREKKVKFYRECGSAEARTLLVEGEAAED